MYNACTPDSVTALGFFLGTPEATKFNQSIVNVVTTSE
jgi:hypothetical protein